MCLYNDLDPADVYRETRPRARTEHRCDECQRTIEPGEHYEQVTALYDGHWITGKMCAHCRASIAVGAKLAGCPEFWYWGTVWSPWSDEGFAEDILGHEHVTGAPRFRFLRLVASARRKWRWSDGTLMAVPT